MDLLQHGHDTTRFWFITEDVVTHAVTKTQIKAYLDAGHTKAQALVKFENDLVALGITATITLDFDGTDGTPKGITFVWGV